MRKQGGTPQVSECHPAVAMRLNQHSKSEAYCSGSAPLRCPAACTALASGDDLPPAGAKSRRRGQPKPLICHCTPALQMDPTKGMKRNDLSTSLKGQTCVSRCILGLQHSLVVLPRWAVLKLSAPLLYVHDDFVYGQLPPGGHVAIEGCNARQHWLQPLPSVRWRQALGAVRQARGG